MALKEDYNDVHGSLERNNLAPKVGAKELEQWRSELLAWHAQTLAAYDQPSHS